MNYNNFNKGSIQFAGTPTSTVFIPNNELFHIPADKNFTIEWFQYETDGNPYTRLFSIGSHPNATLAISLEVGGCYFWHNTNYVLLPYTNFKNKWIHFAVCRSGVWPNQVINIFSNGARINAAPIANNEEFINLDDEEWTIGNEPIPNAGSSYGGYITNFRFTVGYGYYTGNFAVPTSPLGMYAINPYTSLLLNAATPVYAYLDSSEFNTTIRQTNTTWSSASPLFIAPVYRSLGMPPQFYPSAGDSMLSSNRAAYFRTAGAVGAAFTAYNEKKNKIYRSSDASLYAASRRILSIGQSSARVPDNGDGFLSFKSKDANYVKDAKRRCRSSGSAAPAKKGANVGFKSGGH